MVNLKAKTCQADELILMKLNVIEGPHSACPEQAKIPSDAFGFWLCICDVICSLFIV